MGQEGVWRKNRRSAVFWWKYLVAFRSGREYKEFTDGMGHMTVDDLISTFEALSKYTGHSIYQEMGTNGLTVFLIKCRWTPLFIGYGLYCYVRCCEKGAV